MKTGDELSFSVALCSHNGEKFFKEQLDSILNQTVPVQEIIISDDNSQPIFQKFLQKSVDDAKKVFPEIQIRLVLNSKTLGVTKNFEQAARLCSSDIILFADQDDIWAEDKVKIIRDEFLNRPSIDLIFSDAALIDSQGNSLHKTLFRTLYISQFEINEILTGAGYRTLARRNIATGATFAFRREILDIAVPVPDGWIHDEWFAMVAAMKNNLFLIQTCLISYRQHESNQIGVKSLSLRGKFRRLLISREGWNKRLLTRALSLHRWVSDQFLENSPQLEVSSQKLIHEQVRSSYPSSRLLRVWPILKEVSSGRYRSCGLGLQDIFRDLVQPE